MDREPLQEAPRRKRIFNDLPIDRKMTIIVAVPFILMLAVSLVAIQVSFDAYDKRFSASTVKELEYFMYKIDDSLSRLESFSYQLAMNYDIQKQLYENIKIQDYSRYQYEMRFVMLRFLQEVMNSDYIDSFIYTDTERIRYENGRNVIEIPSRIYAGIMEESHEAKGRLIFTGPSVEFPYLLAARDIRYYINADLEYLGTLLFVMDFSNIIAPYEPTLGIGQNYLFIEDENKHIYSSDPTLSDSVQAIAKTIPDRGYSITDIGRKRFFICAVKSPLTGWRFVDMFPYGELFAASLRTRVFLISGFIILYIVVLFSIRRLSRRITRPIKDLSKSMAVVNEGKFDDALGLLGDDFSADEIGQLKSDYAVMLKTIRHLIKENYEKQLLIKDTKYRALKAQINPHFLYNTLNSIGWMVQLKRYDEAHQMLTSLGKLLHRAARPDIMTTVKDEASLLEDYMYIQKIRYEERAVFSLYVHPGTEDMRMPQMLLQPLVENSIYHAVDVYVRPCCVTVEITEGDDSLAIRVKDDGPGMDAATLASARTFTQKRNGRGIGLANIQDRLALIYGADFTFFIDSVQGQGTEVIITIPREDLP